MWCPALLCICLLLCLARPALQGGVKAQGVSWRRIIPARGVGIRTKGVNGAPQGRFLNKPLKAGMGHYPLPSPLGVGGYRPVVPGRVPVYGTPYGANLAALGLVPANGAALGHANKRLYGGGGGPLPVYGVGPVPGYVPYAGQGYPATRPGFMGGAGDYVGGNPAPGAYGPGNLGQGGYLGSAGNLGAPTALGQGGYSKGPAGGPPALANGAAGGYGVAPAGNGLAEPSAGSSGPRRLNGAPDYGSPHLLTAYGNGYAEPYGAVLMYKSFRHFACIDITVCSGSWKLPRTASGPLRRRRWRIRPEGQQIRCEWLVALWARLENLKRHFAFFPTAIGGGAPAQVPYGGAPVAPARHEGDGGYPYGAHPHGLSGDGSKAGKHGPAAYGAPQTGYVPQQLGPAHRPLEAKAAKYGAAGMGPFAGGYKG
ncbi:uncharacterized protein LOC144208539 [Stigmatopora nigra]